MRLQLLIFYVLIALLCTKCQSPRHSDAPKTEEFTRIEFHFSAFGVESNDLPNIDGCFDIARDTSLFKIWFFDPLQPASFYKLTKPEANQLEELVLKMKFSQRRTEYNSKATDLPTSSITFCRAKDTFTVHDYGLIGDQPLQDIYKIVYKVSGIN